MEFYGWKKIIAVGVLIAFIGVGMLWAVEQSGPQFQEKAGTPAVKKAKKFPWLIVLLGTAALGAGIYFLTAKKKEEPAQDVTLNLDVFNHTKTLLKDDFNWNCYRLDWDQTGPQEPWNDAFARLRSGLTKNGIEYGKIILVPGTTGDLRYGYYDYGGFGWHDIVGKWISVNTDKSPSNTNKYWIALAEGLEFFTRYNNRVNVVTEDNKIDDLLCMKFLIAEKPS